ncbi:MAG: response regulator [Fusobacteriaceae bacterium]|nr:response regulator [Fusobacteriaceae bacterium]
MAKILIVDDSEDIRKSIKRTLEKHNHQIFEASNGLEALKILRENDFNLLILDIMMPTKGGIETLLETKNIKNLKKIIITGVVIAESEAFFNLIDHYGAKKILFKPFKKEKLIETVNEVLNT